MDIKDILLTAGVIAAVIGSITNIIIALFNSSQLKKIENIKKDNQMNTYRYTMLYELIKNWHSYDSDFKGKTAGEIAFNRLLNLFMDDLGRYAIAKPLLKKSYVDALEVKKKECEILLEALINAEKPDGTHSEQYPKIRDMYFKGGEEFSELLKETINNQMELLLNKDN